MISGKIADLAVVFLAFIVCSVSNAATAGEVEARLSAREAWVGAPVVLQLSIQNAADYEQPSIPEIDGCDIRSAGVPSQSSQVTIINGRTTQSRSVVMQYLITPRREGTFEIPPLRFKVDGRSVTTQTLRFVATKSETGSLLFVEIEGGKDKVYVGQPLELTLKIWIRPFLDADKKVTLSEADMWQMVSEQSSWGSFLDRMKELAANNQRPGGREVLRNDEQGSERSYYLYEISATVYPKRPGKIDADDVQIVIDYPTALGKARDPFAGFFGGSGLSGSHLSRMMGDDFFSSPFENRLTVSSTRPITAEAKVDATEVMPVPTEGRPEDYRGAVGRYNIVTQATPTAVKAGDAITLNIGIAGTGPMELVQAPPLTELPSLTADFKVADQSLAGFVQDSTKLFTTTIRPRHEGIARIPAIPFSYFDPDTGKYETAMSEPIDITVDKSETLSLDAIVGRQHHDDGRSGSAASAVDSRMEPEFTNDHSEAALVLQSPLSFDGFLWLSVIIPPVAWLMTLIIRHRARISSLSGRLRSVKTRCLTAINQAGDASDVITAMTRYVANRTRTACATSAQAVGALRTSAMTQMAIELEAFFQRCEQSQFNGSSLSEFREEACRLVARIESSVDAVDKSQIRRARQTPAGRVAGIESVVGSAQRISVLILAFLVASSARRVIGEEAFTADSPITVTGEQESQDIIALSAAQRQTVLKEAGELYRRGTEAAKTDSADAMDLFTGAARKYELLVDSGVRNSVLYRDLGNACLQSNQLGRAIVNYERARQLNPEDSQLSVNLAFANSLVRDDVSESAKTASLTATNRMSFDAVAEKVRAYNEQVLDVAGLRMMIGLVAISSLIFWGVQIARAAGLRFPVWRFAIVPMLVLVTSLTSVLLASTQPRNTEDGIIVANNTTLYSGDGEDFDAVITLDTAQGHRVRILATRGHWTQIKTRHGHIGWLPARDVEHL